MIVPALDVSALECPPTLVALPPRAVSFDVGGATIELAAAAGLYLDDWQQLCVRAIMAETPEGRWAAFEACLLVPRQNGKNAILEAVELGAMFLLHERLVIHSAHRFDTSQEHYLRMRELIEGAPFLSRRLYPETRGKSGSFVDTNGKESIKLKPDPASDAPAQRLLFKARARGGGRGFSGNRLVFDEAFDLPAAMLGNVVPALSARPNAQIIYASSPPHADPKSDHLHSVRARALPATHDPDDRLFLASWENEPGVALDDMEAAARVNPALGRRIELDFVRQECRMMTKTPEGRVEYARERLGIPEGGEGASAVVDMALWRDLFDPSSQIAGAPSVALAVSPERTWASFVVVGRREDGLLHVETVRRDEGTAWVHEFGVALFKALNPEAERLGTAQCPILVDPQAQAGAFAGGWADEGVHVEHVSALDYKHACGTLLEEIEGRMVRHLDQASFRQALEGATKRQTDKSWTWARQAVGADITPLEAATLARSAVDDAAGWAY